MTKEQSTTISKETERPTSKGNIANNAGYSSGGKKTTVIIVVIVLLILIGIVVSLYYLLQPETNTEQIRDVFIIFMALESILLGVTLVVLMIQLAKLINILQHEVLPILESTNETISNIRGTTEFLGENITEPVIKINSYVAGASRFFELVGLTKKQKKSTTNNTKISVAGNENITDNEKELEGDEQ